MKTKREKKTAHNNLKVCSYMCLAQQSLVVETWLGNGETTDTHRKAEGGVLPHNLEDAQQRRQD